MVYKGTICVILLYFESWMLSMVGVIVWYFALAALAETMSVDLAAEMPFYQIHDYDLELELTTCKNRILKLLDENKLEDYVKQNDYMCNNFDQWKACEYADEDTFTTLVNTWGTGTLKLYSMNIRSLNKHKGELVAYLSNLPPFDVLVLTEIGSRNIEMAQNLLEGYNFMYVKPNQNYYAGVGIFWRNDIQNFTQADINFNHTCDCTRCKVEALMVNFTHWGIQYSLCGIYRHPNGNVNHFTADLEKMIQQFDRKRFWIIAGDANIDLIRIENKEVQNYLTTLMSYKLIPTITLPTRITSHSQTCIDHIFVKCDANTYITPCVLYNDISDHLPTTVILQNHNKVTTMKRPLVRIFGEINCRKFIEMFRNTDWEQIFASEDDLYSKFIERLNIIYNECFPLRQLSRKRQRDKPWITKGLKISIKYKNKLYRKALTKSSEYIYARYTNYKKILERCIKQAENTYYYELFNNCSNRSKDTWKHLSYLLNKRKSRSSMINKLILDEQSVTDPQEIADALNDHFCTIGERLSDKLPDYGNEYQKYITYNIRDSFAILPVDDNDILREIRNLSPNKAPGSDNIGSKLLKLDPLSFCYPLRKIFNKSIEMGKYPDGMKLAKVVPIFKKGPMYISDNYRPISLLSVFNKIFEKILHRNLMKFLESHNILFMYQFGYRKLHSTTTALIEITDKITKLLDEGNYVIGIYLDLTKAFDTVNHEILLYKLWRYGIRGHANDFFRSYLTNRRQYTCTNEKKSTTRTVNCGVPQGSVLGPLFFILYMNDIVKSVNANNIRLYADDTGIFMHNKNIHNLIKQAKTSFRKLQHWFLCNKLTLNCSKSYFSIFHTKNKHVPDGLNEIVVDDVTIKRSASVKYIGLHIDENLNWNIHIDSLIMTLVKYFGIFNQLKDYVSNQLACKLYYAFVYSNVSYGIEVYGSCSDTSLDRLQLYKINYWNYCYD